MFFFFFFKVSINRFIQISAYIFIYFSLSGKKRVLFTVHPPPDETSGVKRPPFLRTLDPAKFGDLSGWRRDVLPVGSLGSGCSLRGGWAIVGAAATRDLPGGGERSSSRRWPGFSRLLLPAPLLLPQQLLSLQQDPGVDAGCSPVVPGTAGVPCQGLFRGLESLC